MGFTLLITCGRSGNRVVPIVRRGEGVYERESSNVFIGEKSGEERERGQGFDERQ